MNNNKPPTITGLCAQIEVRRDRVVWCVLTPLGQVELVMNTRQVEAIIMGLSVAHNKATDVQAEAKGLEPAKLRN